MMDIDSDLWTMNINIMFLMSALVPTMIMQKNKPLANKTLNSKADLKQGDEKISHEKRDVAI